MRETNSSEKKKKKRNWRHERTQRRASIHDTIHDTKRLCIKSEATAISHSNSKSNNHSSMTMSGSGTFEADVSVAPGAIAVTTLSHQDTVDAKILADLDVLMEKMDLCQNMLRPGDGDPAPAIGNDEAVQSVIGFLEACAPRMVELVEAAAQGALTETVLMTCLEVNDRLHKMLADIDTVAMTETPASTTSASAPSSAATDSAATDIDNMNLDDLLLQDDSDLFGENVIPLANSKSTGEDEEEVVNDPFGNTVLQPTTTSGGANAAVPTSTKAEEEFDSFFNERTTTGEDADKP
jgi:hypothetical protein